MANRIESAPNRGDSHEEEDFGRSLGALLRSYQALVTPALDDLPHGPRGYQVLIEVVRGKHTSQLALAKRLGIDRTVMTYLVDTLEEAGLVAREPNPKDRRRRMVVATDKGAELLARVCGQVASAEDQVLGALDSDERAALRSLLNKAACAIDRPIDPC